MKSDEYLKDRVDHQIRYYERSSKWNKRFFRWLSLLGIIVAALIPFFAGAEYISESCLRILLGALGVIAVIIGGLLSLYKFQENWISFRGTAESLRHEKFLFMTKVEPYNIEDPFPLLVERVESLVSKEHTIWAGYICREKEKESHG